MARSEVTAVTGGTLLLKPCGSSTMTNAMFRSVRKRSVRSAFFSLSHEPLRNSTAGVMPSRRSTASSIVARFSDEGKNQRGNWSRIEPELAGLAQRLEAVAERAPDGVEQLRRQVLGVDPRLGRRRLGQGRADGLGRRLVSVPWPVIRACALMSKVKSGGVRSTHSLAVASAGRA